MKYPTDNLSNKRNHIVFGLFWILISIGTLYADYYESDYEGISVVAALFSFGFFYLGIDMVVSTLRNKKAFVYKHINMNREKNYIDD
jgi:ABC-type transport system involved in cytochrome c biogenesis permease subunit